MSDRYLVNLRIEKELNIKKKKKLKVHHEKCLMNNIPCYSILTSSKKHLAPAVEGIHIFFPISPKLCILLANIPSNQSLRHFKIDKINRLIVEQAHEYVFSNNAIFHRISDFITNYTTLEQKLQEITTESVIIDEKKIKNNKNIKFRVLSPDEITTD